MSIIRGTRAMDVCARNNIVCMNGNVPIRMRICGVTTRPIFHNMTSRIRNLTGNLCVIGYNRAIIGIVLWVGEVGWSQRDTLPPSNKENSPRVYPFLGGVVGVGDLEIYMVLFLTLAISTITRTRAFIFDGSPIRVSTRSKQLNVVIRPAITASRRAVALGTKSAFILATKALAAGNELFSKGLIITLVHNGALVSVVTGVALELSSGGLPLTCLGYYMDSNIRMHRKSVVQLLAARSRRGCSCMNSSCSCPTGCRVPTIGRM